jgi:formate hydrogenlyase subunit 6/NADH:ubiquinone oxidoreductase subunit I
MLVITSECVVCGECVDVCPVGAIVEGEDQYQINGLCLGSTCQKCVHACPVDAIKASME